MTTTAARATARDLGASRKAYASRLEEATGFTIRWGYDQREGAWVFYLIDPYGDVEGDPWHSWADLVHDTQDAVDEYELDLCEGELWNHPGNWPDGPWLAACTEFTGSDADPGL